MYWTLSAIIVEGPSKAVFILYLTWRSKVSRNVSHSSGMASWEGAPSPGDLLDARLWTAFWPRGPLQRRPRSASRDSTCDIMGEEIERARVQLAFSLVGPRFRAIVELLAWLFREGAMRRAISSLLCFGLLLGMTGASREARGAHHR